MPTVTIDIRPEYIRAAIQSAAGLGLKFPSLAAEEHLARFLSWINWTVVGTSPEISPETTPAEPEPTEPETEKFIIEFPLSGRWVRSTDYPGAYTSAEADKIMTDDLSGIRVGYRVNFIKEEMFIIELYWGPSPDAKVWSRSLTFPDVYSAKRADEIISSAPHLKYRKTVYL